MGIPIQNIYYLLCYAWNKLEERDRVNISIEDNTTLQDLFAKILINATKLLLKRGIDRTYVNHSEEIAGIRGKVDLSATLKRGIHRRQRAICSFDEFSPNILLNQILVTTMYRLARTRKLDSGHRDELVRLTRLFPGIELVELKATTFKNVKLNRNNRFYGLLLNVCEIIFECSLPGEEKGYFQFKDFRRDENKMNQLFEAFIRNFYRIEQSEFSKVRKETIKWRFTSDKSEDFNFLPQMETDITLENASRKIVIDAKFYSQTMTTNRSEKQKINSSNLYQLFSYLLNQETDDPKTKEAHGILLYPTIEEDYDLAFRYFNHAIQIKTVNLNSDWRSIDKRLKEIIGLY